MWGAVEGIRRASKIRRVGAHRRCDAEGQSEIRGMPRYWNPQADVQPGDLRVCFLDEGEMATGRPEAYDGEKKIYRMPLRRECFLQRGYTEGCPGCQLVFSDTPLQRHSERCRARMEEADRSSWSGQQRNMCQVEKEDEKLARKVEEADNRAAKGERRQKKGERKERARGE